MLIQLTLPDSHPCCWSRACLRFWQPKYFVSPAFTLKSFSMLCTDHKTNNTIQWASFGHRMWNGSLGGSAGGAPAELSSEQWGVVSLSWGRWQTLTLLCLTAHMNEHISCFNLLCAKNGDKRLCWYLKDEVWEYWECKMSFWNWISA